MESEVRYTIIEEICGKQYRKCIFGARALNPDGKSYVIRVDDKNFGFIFQALPGLISYFLTLAASKKQNHLSKGVDEN